jgi:DNA-binding transcriptional MerR regulator/methylmalonyl-CoA mutase cobalamin-binding subunit
MKTDQAEVPRHPIRVVSRRTGLTPAVLRAWEKRYGVVTPSRSVGGQRLYSDEDVTRLSLLRKAVDEGRAISQVADLSTQELSGLVREDAVERVGPPAVEPIGRSSVSAILEDATSAVRAMDPKRLEGILYRSALALPVPVLIDDVVAPLLTAMGVFWREGRLGPAHEHVATVVVRRFLEWLLSTVEIRGSAPVLVAATAAGERHELGALLSAVTGSTEGWSVYFLGPDLPSDEIASAALRLEAKVVALSSVDPGAAESLQDEVQALRKRLPSDITLLLGGSMAIERKDRLEEGPGVKVLKGLDDLREALRGML